MNTELLGSFGENCAAAFMKKIGYRVTGMNYRTRFGEIDLICENRRFIVFAEVKLRKNDRHGEAREYVSRGKQNKVIAASLQWLQLHPTNKQPRFDVIEVYAPFGTETKSPDIIHWENAFSTDSN